MSDDDVPYEVRVLRATRDELAGRETALAAAVAELERVRGARADLDKLLARAERRAGVNQPAAAPRAKPKPAAPREDREPMGTRRPGDDTDAGRILAYLEREKRATVGVISSRTGVPGGHTHTALQRLREKGFVQRVAEGTYAIADAVAPPA